ncbi:interferon-related developmental regulator 2 isoform X4 [Lagenorhynchus albirostris]|uniref:interferon-related developmental regulator 2 isoform X4 n=1 Tax=Lagenorhynchus albirostris TaxID=27610 RepID=UPI0028E1AD91|nr:interferon-related developmental regulator 2 isoform X4 [Lagenorhynchus albirostris]
MPRARKGSAPRRGGKRSGGGARSSTQADSGSSEDEAASEARSTTSECPSLLSTAAEESFGGDAVDEQGQQEDLEEKLKEYVDCLTDKSAKTRQGALESLRLALAAHLLPDFWLERRLTLADALEKCLKKGPGLLPHLLGRHFQPVLWCGWLHSPSGPCQPSGLALCCSAGLGLATHHLPQRPYQPHPGQLPRLPQLLSSESVNLRMAAGETIALLFELTRDLEEDFVYKDMEALCSALRTLATDSNKYRAKADRRRQRSTFRAVLHSVEGGECEEETVRFGLEVLYVDSWARRRVYAAFKDALGSGMHHHLQNNELLRDIFGLGPVLVLDATALKACKISRFEKHLYNAAAFKARTKARSRVRDKRADIL